MHYSLHIKCLIHRLSNYFEFFRSWSFSTWQSYSSSSAPIWKQEEWLVELASSSMWSNTPKATVQPTAWSRPRVMGVAQTAKPLSGLTRRMTLWKFRRTKGRDLNVRCTVSEAKKRKSPTHQRIVIGLFLRFIFLPKTKSRISSLKKEVSRRRL